MIFKLAFGVFLLNTACQVICKVIVTACPDEDADVCAYCAFSLKQYVRRSEKLSDIVHIMNLERLKDEREAQLKKLENYTPALLKDDIMDVKVSIMVCFAREVRSVPYCRMLEHLRKGQLSIDSFDYIMLQYFTLDNSITHLMEVIDRMSGEIFPGQRNYSEEIIPALVKLFSYAVNENLLVKRSFTQLILDYKTSMYNRLTVYKSYIWNRFDWYIKNHISNHKYNVIETCKRGLKRKFYPQFFYHHGIMDSKAFSELWQLTRTYRAGVCESEFKRYFSRSALNYCRFTNLQSKIGLLTLYRSATVELKFDTFLKPFLWNTLQYHSQPKDYKIIFAEAVSLISAKRRQFSYDPNELVGEKINDFNQRLDVYLKERFDELSSITNHRQFVSKLIRKMKYFWKIYKANNNSWFNESINYAATWAEAYDLREELYGKSIKPETLRNEQFLQYDSNSEHDEDNIPVINVATIDKLKVIVADNDELMKKLSNLIHPDDIFNANKLERLFVPIDGAQNTALPSAFKSSIAKQLKHLSPIAKINGCNNDCINGKEIKMEPVDEEITKILPNTAAVNNHPIGKTTSTPKPTNPIVGVGEESKKSPPLPIPIPPPTNQGTPPTKANTSDEGFEIITPPKK